MIKHIVAKYSAAALLTLAAITSTPTHASAEPMIGELRLVAFTFCPRGWDDANGKSMQISSNSALFSLLGTQYGGDGRTTFNLPNLKGPTIRGSKRRMRWCIATQGIYPSRR